MAVEFQLGSVIIRDGDSNGVIYYHTRQDKYFDESGQEISLTEADRRVREESGFLMLDSIVVEDAIAGLQKLDESKNTQDPEKARLLFLQGMEFLGKANVRLVDDWETQAFSNYSHVFSRVEDMRWDMERQLQMGRTQIPEKNPTRLGSGAIVGFSTDDPWKENLRTGNRVGGAGWAAAAAAALLSGIALFETFKKPDPAVEMPALFPETTPDTGVDVGADSYPDGDVEEDENLVFPRAATGPTGDDDDGPRVDGEDGDEAVIDTESDEVERADDDDAPDSGDPDLAGVIADLVAKHARPKPASSGSPGPSQSVKREALLPLVERYLEDHPDKRGVAIKVLRIFYRLDDERLGALFKNDLNNFISIIENADIFLKEFLKEARKCGPEKLGRALLFYTGAILFAEDKAQMEDILFEVLAMLYPLGLECSSVMYDFFLKFEDAFFTMLVKRPDWHIVLELPPGTSVSELVDFRVRLQMLNGLFDRKKGDRGQVIPLLIVTEALYHEAHRRFDRLVRLETTIEAANTELFFMVGLTPLVLENARAIKSDFYELQALVWIVRVGLGHGTNAALIKDYLIQMQSKLTDLGYLATARECQKLIDRLDRGTKDWFVAISSEQLGKDIVAIGYVLLKNEGILDRGKREFGDRGSRDNILRLGLVHENNVSDPDLKRQVREAREGFESYPIVRKTE